MQWLGLVARLVTGGVWLWAGLIKLPDLASSVVAVRAYQLLPEAVVPAVGHLLPPLEVLIGLCLLLGIWVRPAALVSSLLFVGFIVAIASLWARGLEIDCGCFGSGGARPGASAKYPWEIARDVALLAASVWLVIAARTPWSLAALVGHDVRDWCWREPRRTQPENVDENDPGQLPDTRRDR